jgi:peptidyl-prolyl cis-trans isomerase B (cyclophilin B)
MSTSRRILRLAPALALAGGALALAACGDGDETTTSTAAGGKGACEEVAPAEPKQVKLEPPTEKVEPGEQTTATVETNCGDFQFELDTENAPKTASSFVQLVDEGVYDGTAFHRVVDGFVIQGGDPAGDGSGGPGYSVTEEPPPDAEYTRGTVAMAKTAVEPAGTSGSQFFVVTAADAGLPPDYAILGHLTGDESAVDLIEAQADPDLGPEGGEPAVPVVIERITLE